MSNQYIKSLISVCLLVQAVQIVSVRSASAYHPQHPDVRAMVDKGVDYLENLSDRDIAENRWGGAEFHVVLIAIAHYKARHDASAPTVQRGLDKAIAYATQARQQPRSIADPSMGAMDKSNYGLSVCIVLLCEVDSAKYKRHIIALRDNLLSQQQAHGGFGYSSEQQGDTSQVQYVVLAFWAMKENGIEVEATAVNKVNQWLLRVQDVGGAWPYRATDPGPGKGLIKQGTQYMSHSTALAGASSILIAGDFFGLWRGNKPGKQREPSSLPTAIRELGKLQSIRVEPKSSRVKAEDILESVDLMNRYRERVSYEQSGSEWHYYSMYSLERFESFHEIARDQVTPEPEWYNNGVETLKSNQAASGGWGIMDRAQSPPAIATCFAILFLVRSTQQSILMAKSGALAGGRDLPDDTTDIKVNGTKIVGRRAAAAVGEMLDLLEDETGDLDGKTILDDLELAKDPKERRAQLDRLERLVRGSRSWQARRVAARLLGTSEQMRVVPSLIFALSDPDKTVRTYARDGLRFISRRFDGFGLSDEPTDREIKTVQKNWREWYLKINPKYVFLD